MKRSSLALVAALLAAVAVHFSVAWQDLPTLARNGYLYDDSFYAFQIARSIAAGNGPTFDGATLTNGFQPLYVFLLVPLFMMSGGDPVLPIHLSLAMLALFSVATGFVLYLILRRYVSEVISVSLSAFWVLSPVVIRQTANGLETALAVLMMALSIYYYLSRIRDHQRPTRGSMIRLGILLGLTVLARLDQVFLAMAMTLDYLLVARRRGESTRRVAGNAGALGATALAVYSPWLIYGVVAVGRILPESGAATRFLSLAYAPFFGMGSSELVTSGPDAGFIWAHVVRAVSVLKLTPITHTFFRVIERFTAGTPVADLAAVAANVIGIAMLGAFVAWVMVRSRRGDGERMRELSFLLLFSASLIAAYSFYVFGVFFFIRYFYPVHFVAMIFAGFLVRDLSAWVVRMPPVWKRAAVTAGVLYTAGHLFMGFNCCYRSTPVYHFYDVALWVEENTNENETIGVFQSGTIGYLSNRKVINLDGKVNGDALKAMKAGELESYVGSAGIDVLLDHTSVIELFLATQDRSSARRCFSGAESGLPGWVGYRLSAPGEDRAGAASSSATDNLSR